MMSKIENILQDLKCMLIEDGYTESNIVLRTLIKAQEQVKLINQNKDDELKEDRKEDVENSAYGNWFDHQRYS